VVYARVPRLFADLELAHGDGRFTRLFRTLVKADLLVLDDWGPERLTANQRRDLMEIVEDRHGNGSTLITSQLPRDKWHDVRGRHPRSHRSQCLSARVRRAINAQAPSQRIRRTRASTREQSGRNCNFTRHQTSKRRTEMTAVPNFPPAPVGQQDLPRAPPRQP
jgi:DNA replication protein DnaC